MQCTCRKCGLTSPWARELFGASGRLACPCGSKRVDVTAICETCGKTVPVLFSRQIERRYCSHKCWGRAQGLANRDATIARNRKWSDEETAFLIAHYPKRGSQFIVDALGKTLSQVQGKVELLRLRLTKEARHATSGVALSQRMGSNNPMHQPSVRQKVRTWQQTPEGKAAAARAVEARSHINRKAPSRLERRMAAMLTDLGVAFESSVFIKPNFIVDFRIGSLIIEADGDWWHGHPRFEPLTPRQIAQQTRDVARNAYLTACGYTVVRIWESDLSPELLRRTLAEHDLVS